MAISPDISVAMCTYNGAQYIVEQLESMAAQTLLPAEIVVSDDGSTDGTVALLKQTWERLAEHSSGVRKVKLTVLSNKTSLGVTKNFEQAIAATTKHYIFLADQDDIWFPARLETEIAQLNAGAGFVFGDAQLINESGEPLGHSLFEALALSASERTGIVSRPVDVLIKRNIVTGATAAFSRSVFEKASPFPAGWVHDEWLAMVAALTGERFAVTESLIGYRQHSSNQIGVKKNTLATRMAKLRAEGAERNARLLARITSLSERTEELGASSSAQSLIVSSMKFQQARSAYPRNRAIRWVPVLGQVLTGRYFRVSNGPRDVLRDLVQPL
ncbi:glycosyltransferase involved in cell wall biosynthesis [Aurantimicrobium minutum]|uniref:glycosyltransferase family 2 protein n=1 Tax=Aurantimicrobium minutum TaxID=708131 RepID=UPI002474F332|nr:glycosyltransferase family 2 protein [Aurantimicrobium minutum]MDH6425063.1 glycosyltransferase involved in cell wall biosynthesis [Aurantimicrobium minutum]